MSSGFLVIKEKKRVENEGSIKMVNFPGICHLPIVSLRSYFEAAVA